MRIKAPFAEHPTIFMTSAASVSARSQAPALHPGSSTTPAPIDTAALHQVAEQLRHQLLACRQQIDHLTGRLRDITGSSKPQDVAAHKEMHAFLQARSIAQLAMAGSSRLPLPRRFELECLPDRARELVGLHDDRDRHVALYRRHEVDLILLEEQLEQAGAPRTAHEDPLLAYTRSAQPDPDADTTARASANANASEPVQDDRAMSADDRLASLKGWFDECVSARSHWLKTLVATAASQPDDVDVASAFVKQQLMGAQDVSASAIWQWMDKLPGFTELTAGQQHVVKLVAAYKVEDGSCWKTAVQIEAHEAAMTAQPALRLKLREELLEKFKPVQHTCSELYMRASATHPDDHEFILGLQDSWKVRRQFTLALVRQIRADRKEIEQAATAPDDSGAAGATPVETLQSLRANEVKLIGLRNQASVALQIARLGVPLDRAMLAQCQSIVDMYKQSLAMTQSRIRGQLDPPWRATALPTGRQETAADAQRLGDLQRAHAAQAQTLWGVLARLGEAQRGLSRHDNDSLDSFTEAMVRAGKQDPLAWHSVERLPGYTALTGPVKKAAQLVAQSKVCNVAVRGLEVEIATLKAQAETKG